MPDPADLNGLKGLSTGEAAARLATCGPNELPRSSSRGLFRLVFDVAREPMLLLLLATGLIYLFAAREPADALMLLGFVLIVITITIVQERRTDNALSALRRISSPRALVVRDGERVRIPGREVVPGDLLIVSEGDRVAADGRLIDSMNLFVDESCITGESVPVLKTASDRTDARIDGAAVFSGTLVASGYGIAEVTGTGADTELGRIGTLMKETDSPQTPIQRETGRLVARLAVLGLSLCAVTAIASALSRGGTMDAWKDGLLAGITLAMATLPEEFPVVLTIFLALGAWRLSKHGVLSRTMPAVEALGTATFLCVDKTGTLTMNTLELSEMDSGACSWHGGELPEELHRLLEYAILASKGNPLDPVDRAVREAGSALLSGTVHLHDDWVLVREYPLSAELMALSHVWRSPTGDAFLIASKGAPEAIVDLCHSSPGRIVEIESMVQRMAARGLKVLGVAAAAFDGRLPEGQHDLAFEFLGLVGLNDPIRPGVSGSVAECRGAGINVMMITGDYPATAMEVASKLGLGEGAMLTGAELDRLSDEELMSVVPDVSVFARAVPRQKLRVVEALRRAGETVAMTGDGVNDAPALKAADIGVAMGARGTDVAREAAGLVLLDDNFGSIVRAVRQGRRIRDNISKAFAYIVAVHIPVAGLSLLPVLAGLPLILMPVHVAFLEMIIDPACSIVFEVEGEERDLMHRPPDSKRRLFGRKALLVSSMQGLSALAVTVAVFLWAIRTGHSENDTRALTFSTLVVSNIMLIATNRSWKSNLPSILRTPNRAMWITAAGAMAFLALVIYIPFLGRLFHFDRLHAGDLLLCMAAGAFGIAWFEVYKLFARKRVCESAVNASERR
ncbi:MAG TPA: cation-translocating P-type ATPase [Candidatus Fermentibacter daniensis]|nr:cation-translocating P-type ATPase [Candidatus Fermentibacter daniensis]HOG55282.1 cation-translocating P-type ATPase [Candidatus Fermentibacter daniensis]